MPYRLETAVREILRPTHQMQPFEATYLTRARFRLEKGVWVRRVYLEIQTLEAVLDVPEGR